MKTSLRIMRIVSISSMFFLALFVAACGGGGGDGETTVADGDGETTVADEGESQAFITQTSGADGKVSITFDSGQEGTFLITDTSDNPLQGIDSYIYKDSKGATIIASDAAGNYATKVYSAEHFSTQQITLSNYDSNGVSIKNSYIIPDHLDTSALGAVDTSWEQYTESIDDVISSLDIAETSFNVVVDIIHGTASTGSYLVSAILFEDIKTIKEIFDWYWSDDFRYTSTINTQNSLALVRGDTALPYGTLIVRVENASGTGISNASVGISDSFLSQAQTAFNGYARIDGISPGTHTVEVSHSDYDSATVQADIPSAGRAEIIEIELSPSSTTDTTSPSIPTGLTATTVSSSQIDLSWTAATDDVGVTGYKVYRDGSYLKSVTSASTSDTGLSSSTQYCYSVSAYDAAGNVSNQSSQDCATTSSSTSDKMIYVTVFLDKLPTTLTINQAHVSDYSLEYCWEVLIDSDNNLATGDQEGFDVSFAISHYVFPDSIEQTVDFLSQTQENTWILDPSGGGTWGHDLSVNLDFNTNSIEMVGSGTWEELQNVSSSNRFKVETYYEAPMGSVADATDDGYNSISDPKGDVSHDFVDILEAQINVY